MKYAVRPRAWLDLEETMKYLRSLAGDETAVRFWLRTQDTFNWLTQHPDTGRPRPDLRPPGLRSWRVSDFEKWLIFYRAAEGQVEILRVRHGMMDLPKIFEAEPW